MTITICNYPFEGPYPDTSYLRNEAGIYVILDYDVNHNTYSVLDVGESEQVKRRIDFHDRRDCWNQHCRGTLAVAVLYIPSSQENIRMANEMVLRRLYQPTCGVR